MFIKLKLITKTLPVIVITSHVCYQGFIIAFYNISELQFINRLKVYNKLELCKIN